MAATSTTIGCGGGGILVAQRALPQTQLSTGKKNAVARPTQGRCPTDFDALEALLPQLLRVPGGTRNSEVQALVALCEQILSLRGEVQHLESRLGQDQGPRMGLCHLLQDAYLKILGTTHSPQGLTKARLQLAAEAVQALPSHTLSHWACGGLGLASQLLAHLRSVVNPAVKQCLEDHKLVWQTHFQECQRTPPKNTFKERWHLLRSSKRCQKLEKQLRNLVFEFNDSKKEWEKIEMQYDRVLGCAAALNCIVHPPLHVINKKTYEHTERLQKYVVLKLENLLEKRLENKEKEYYKISKDKEKLLESLEIQVAQKYTSLKNIPKWNKPAHQKEHREKISQKWLNIFSSLEKNLAFEIDNCQERYKRIQSHFQNIKKIDELIEEHLCEGTGKTSIKGSAENWKLLKNGSLNKNQI